MLELFKSNKNFCNVSVKPWIIILTGLCFLIVVWGIYQYEMESEALMENLKQKISGNASVLANFPASQQTIPPSDQQQEHFPYQPPYSLSPGTGAGAIAVNSLHNLENSFKQAIATARPSVVNIKSTRIDGSLNQNSVYESVGSGLIVSPQGHILTNYHVIANTQNIFVTVYDKGKKTYNAWILDYHMDTDLTLLKLETTDRFTPAILGNSDLVETGDMVLAIGNPFGMDQTVTSGIVSGMRKTLAIEGLTYENMIQTDVPINRGSSGGPLVNIDGEVIGINTAIYAPTGVFSGTAFAMPVNRVKRFLTTHNIVYSGVSRPSNVAASFSVNKGLLGVEIQPVDRTIALHLGLPYIGGVLVNRVIQDSPASRKGLEQGDVILEIDGNEIIGIDDFEKRLTDLIPGESVKLLVYRGRQLSECFITLSPFPR